MTSAHPRLLVFALAFTASTAPAQFHIDEGEANDLYLINCAACHGRQLEGGTAGSLIDGKWLHAAADPATLSRIISEGIPETPMVAWKHVLRDDQIRALALFVLERERVTDRAALAQRLQPQDGIFHSARHSFRLEKVGQGEGILWGFDFLPDGGLIASQRDGALWIFPPTGAAQKIAGLPPVWHPGGESGLFDIKLHPDYSRNGWIYLSFSDPGDRDSDGQETGMTAVIRGRIVGGRWIDQQTIFRADPAEYTKAMHLWGSRLLFHGGYLYFTVGVRVENPASQDLTQARGKIHRVYDDGRVPPDNPFASSAGACASIWSIGHRNPQGLAWRPGTHELWASEHGPRGGDEINRIEKGQNYGWPLATFGMNYDGTLMTEHTELPDMVSPIWHWVPSIGTGGMTFYTGNEFPAWRGSLFQGGMWSEALRRLELVENEVVTDEIVFANQGRVRYVAQSPAGHLYVSLTVGEPRVGAIYRLVPVEPSS